MDKRDLAFGRMNFILLGVGMLLVVIGFILMAGGSSSNEAYNPDIFSARRIKVAPMVCLLGFVSMIYAVVHKPKDNGLTQVNRKEDKAE
ncbi:MAG: DUF3098 domain-containing protein [Prevotella sp.]|nr:DUF3098 domain-containing protein [Prevotella sp.]